jgi:NAD(P)-dependent dehydrogenase (short-subunit alcohol dehydrogenase family)
MSSSSTKTVLVTGATSGIGRFTALHLAKRGYHVIGSGRREAELAKLKDEAASLGHRLDVVAMDVTSESSIANAKAAIDRLTGGRGIDVLVNNAGFGLIGPLTEISDAELRRQYDTNVFGLMAVTRAFVPAMQARRAGRVINVSSVGGRMTFPFMGAYNSTKYAVESLSDALRWELKPFGIDVALIEPGVIRTEFADIAMQGTDKFAGSPYSAAISKADKLRARMEATASGPLTVAKAIERAIKVYRPAPRYIAPRITWLALLFKSITPDWMWDWTMRKFAFLGLVEKELASTPKAAQPATEPARKAA